MKSYDEWLQIDASNVSVLYDNGEVEDLATHDVIRDGLLSLGWVNAQGSPPSDYGNQLSPEAASAAGDLLLLCGFGLQETSFSCGRNHK